MMSEKDKIHSQELYLPMDNSIMAEQLVYLEKQCDYNATRPLEFEKRASLLKEMFGPNVTLATAGHPILPELRQHGYQYNAPIHIGKNCWLGAGVIVMPGVTIGDNTIIGAGSIVTKDIPANVVAVGNPCKVMRPINERDKEYYFKNHKINWNQVHETLSKK